MAGVAQRTGVAGRACLGAEADIARRFTPDHLMRAGHAAWSYSDPVPDFAPIAGYLAFYPGRVDACFVDGERVVPQEGAFYGGWITSKVAGPFKGPPGTAGW